MTYEAKCYTAVIVHSSPQIQLYFLSFLDKKKRQLVIEMI